MVVGGLGEGGGETPSGAEGGGSISCFVTSQRVFLIVYMTLTVHDVACSSTLFYILFHEAVRTDTVRKNIFGFFPTAKLRIFAYNFAKTVNNVSENDKSNMFVSRFI